MKKKFIKFAQREHVLHTLCLFQGKVAAISD